MRKVSYEILKKFCYDGDIMRKYMNYPNIANGYCVASDNHILIMVKKEYCEKFMILPDLEEYPDVFKIVDPAKVSAEYEVSLDDLKEALGKCEKIEVEEIRDIKIEVEYEKCPVCQGDGKAIGHVNYRGRNYVFTGKCPYCQGYKKVPKDESYDPDFDDARNYAKREFVKTGEIAYNRRYVVRIGNITLMAEFVEKVIEYMEHIGVTSAKCQEVVPSKIIIIFPQSIICVMGMIGNNPDWVVNDVNIKKL